MRNEETSFRRIVRPWGSIHKLANLKSCGPHGAVSSSNRSIAFTVVEHLMRYKSSTKTQQTKFDTTNIDATRSSLVNNMEILNFILPAAELFQNCDILTSTPYRIYGNGQLNIPR